MDTSEDEADEAPEITSSKLDHLPVIGQALGRLGLRQVVDELCPPDPRHIVTHGECVEAMIAAILLGTHTLYEVGDTLQPYDLEAAFGWTHDPEQFNDERLGRALDALVDAGLMPINAAAAVRSMKVYALSLARMHLDTTSASVFGQYEESEEPEDPEAPGAIPHVTRGYSKDHRPDLKQIVFGLSVTSDGHVPIYGRVASGNRNDCDELRYTMERIRDVLPDPRATTLVGDSKFFSGETAVLARQFGFDFVCMLPRGVGLWGEAYSTYRTKLAAGEQPALLKGVELVTEDGAPLTKTWKGLSLDMKYRWTEGEGESAREHEVPLRALVVESSSLTEQKRPALERRRDKEREKIEKAAATLAARAFVCREDAERAAQAKCERLASDFFRLETKVESEQREVKRERPGRPRADEKAELETVWRARLVIDEEHTSIDELAHRDGCYVLVTTLPKEGANARTDEQVLQDYQGQQGVEAAMHWLKGPLAVAPIFLKTPERIAALGLVYVLALMVYALIQRDMRQRLAKKEDLIPGNKGWTDAPTTEVIFRLMRGLGTVRLGDGKALVTNITTPQLDALRILDCPLLARPDVQLTKATKPAPGRRGGGAKKRAAKNPRSRRQT